MMFVSRCCEYYVVLTNIRLPTVEKSCSTSACITENVLTRHNGPALCPAPHHISPRSKT